MTCSICYLEIDEGEPMLVVDAALNGQTAQRFTGVVWHPVCSPIAREHLMAEARLLSAIHAERTSS